MQCVCCIMYIKNIFCTQFMYLKYNSLLLANVQRIDKDYTQYTIQNTLTLYAVCEVFTV